MKEIVLLINSDNPKGQYLHYLFTATYLSKYLPVTLPTYIFSGVHTYAQKGHHAKEFILTQWSEIISEALKCGFL